MTSKKLSEQDLIQLLHAAMENRLDDRFNRDISYLLLLTNNLSVYSIDEAFWFIELAKVLARNHDKRGVQLIQKMYMDQVLSNFYAKRTPGTSPLGQEMRDILGYYGDKEILMWLSQVDGQKGASTLYPYPDSSLKVEMNRIAERIGIDKEKRLTKSELEFLLDAIKNDTKSEQQDQALSKLVSDEYDLADFVIGIEAWILLELADTLAEKNNPQGKALLRKMHQDAIPGSSEFGEAFENSVMAYEDSEIQQDLEARRKQKAKPD